MEKTKEDNNDIYKKMSKANIDVCIRKNDYRKAFLLLIMVLEKLNDTEKVEFINYYNNRLCDLTVGISNLDDHRSLHPLKL